MNPYRELFTALNDAEIRYLIVGGVAVNLHGYRRFTGDIDIVLALDPENLEKVTTLMHNFGYIERLPIMLQELSNEETVKRLLIEKGMTAYTFLSNKRERIDMDILAGESLRFDELEGRKVMLDLEEGLKVPVIAVSDLIAMKQVANREKDIQDVQMLLELKSL